MAKDIDAINLLPTKGNNLLEQFLNWSLTIGRLLIILTETLALGTFLYRFSLDMQIVDLHDEIKQKSAIVKAFTQEDAFRNLQQRILLIKKYDAQSSITPTVFHDIAEMGRGKVTYRNLVVTTDFIKIEAQAPSANTLMLFVKALRDYPLVKSVSIDKVENKTSSATVIISITATLTTAQPTPAKNKLQNTQTEKLL